MFNIGPQELLLIVVVALVVVGPKRLPELGRTIGKGLREVRKAQDEVRRTVRDTIGEEERPRFGAPTPVRAPEAGETDGGDSGGEANADAQPPAATSDVRDISRTLGQSLSELRQAREDIQRSLRVEPDPPSRPGRRRARSRAATPRTAPAAPTAAGAEEATAPSNASESSGGSTDATEPTGSPDATEPTGSPAEE
jgi:sec-independent protein translocase protein TatA